MIIRLSAGTVGTVDGKSDGGKEGVKVGSYVVVQEGLLDGTLDGKSEGNADGTAVGAVVGIVVGTTDGRSEGSDDGINVGTVVGNPGCSGATTVGTTVGYADARTMEYCVGSSDIDVDERDRGDSEGLVVELRLRCSGFGGLIDGPHSIALVGVADLGSVCFLINVLSPDKPRDCALNRRLPCFSVELFISLLVPSSFDASP